MIYEKQASTATFIQWLHPATYLQSNLKGLQAQMK